MRGMGEALQLMASATFGGMTYITQAVLLVFYIAIAVTVVGAVLLAKKLGKK